MRSLRARLLAAALSLTTLGLLVLGGVTYVSQRSLLHERVDDETRAAPPVLERELSELGIGGDDGGFRDGGPREGGPPRGDPLGPPAGSYGELRDVSGRVLGATTYDPSQQGLDADPALPTDVPPGRLFTVDGENGDQNRYRVLAERDNDGGGMLIVAVPLAEADQTLGRLLLVEALVIAVVLLVLGLVGWAVVRVGLLPLDRIGRTAGAIAAGDLSRRVESADARTEVGRLGIALNAMLERLEKAFAERRASEDRLRHFIADASHELRTPLASIRGYAELFRMGATRGASERERAMQRIEDEAARMGVLVDDLLMLARLDQGPDADHTELDLAALTRDAVDDARAMAPDRQISLHAAPATVLGDAPQLRQVLANLIRNALVHTPAGTPVDVSVTADPDAVRLEVRDHGPGLPSGEPQQLFERFWRAEHGRERGKAGAGLGLSIVAGIVEAHGGRVYAADASGGGASFVVELPVA